MLKKILLLVTLFYQLLSYSQKDYPKNYFQNPLEINTILAGTFGELRSNHFHGGLDIKTDKREGLKVLASASGYVSRIKVSHGGYGKALYITHPNGYTTVYGHLQKFSPTIESYVKRNQYNKESFVIQLFPQVNQLKVEKGKLVAYSGNTGGSTAAHLHFEIRDTQTAKTINPMHFGITAKDHRKPSINSGYVYPLDEFSQINQSNKRQKLQITRQENGDLLANTITASGSIGVGINAFDRLDEAMNKNGLYKLEVFVNQEKIYTHDLETFSFPESKYINLLIDYAYYKKKKTRIQRCFIVRNNKLSIYKNVQNNGTIYVQNGENYTIKILASDFNGNTAKLIIPVIGKTQDVLDKKQKPYTTHYLKRNEFNKLSKDMVTVAIPKYSFYNDVNFNFKVENGVATIHNNTVPLHKKFTLTFNTKHITNAKKKNTFIGRVNKNGYVSYVYTKRKENKLYTTTKVLGVYKLEKDTKKPTVTPKSFKNKQWLTNFMYLKVKIKDDKSGIKSYRATVDGKWILMEYEPKNGYLTYSFSDNKINFKTKGAKHTLKIIVKDNVNNTQTYTAIFYRAK